ncbi:MAG: DUF401 family protein [Bacillota bacterium]
MLVVSIARLGVPQVYGFLGATLVICLSKGSLWLEVFKAAVSSLAHVDSIDLVLSIGLITMLGRLMQAYGYLGKMASSLGSIARRREIAVMAVPALLGTLSTYGGAILSAPAVEALGKELGLSPLKDAAINIIFRHTLIFVNPFSPTLILAAKAGMVSIRHLILLQFPLFLVMFWSGYRVLFRGVALPGKASAQQPNASSVRDFLASAAPLLVCITLAAVVGLKVMYSAGVGLAYVMVQQRRKLSLEALQRATDLWLVGAVAGIVLYKGAMSQLEFVSFFVEWCRKAGVSLEALAVVMCLLLGLSSGSSQTPIAVVLPLVVVGNPPYPVRLFFASLVYVTSVLAYVVSPLHLCQILTTEYFKVKTEQVYAEYWPVIAVTAVASSALYLVFRATITPMAQL